ncbi:hypothetical protein AWENTII_002640 [Aspergillus wentii]
MGRLDRFLRRVHARQRHQQSPPVSVTAQSEPKSVFAHFIVGNAAAMTVEQWEWDIIEAQRAHIDGFALNIAQQDSYTQDVLDKAYFAAEKLGNFSLFLSFDYLSGGPWPTDRVVTLINTYKNLPAQFHYKGKPLVSTFEGAGNTGDWAYIKEATGCIFIPCWTSLGPAGVASIDAVDGAFSWDAWPTGAEDKDATSDEAWIKALAGKPYMMPVSPWFYTNLPQWGKNWLWRGDDLWHYRWQQIMDLQPDLVQIISWNDYGEAHYIGPIREAGIPDGAARYVDNRSHDAWRALLPHYINAYRTKDTVSVNSIPGAVAPMYNPKYPISFEEKITYWYRLNPSDSGSADGTTGNNPSMGQTPMAPGEISQDRIFVTALVMEPSDVYVQIGENYPTVLQASSAGINHFSIPFNEQTGSVWLAIVRNGWVAVETVGPAVTEECEDGSVNWNAFVGCSHEYTTW